MLRYSPQTYRDLRCVDFRIINIKICTQKESDEMINSE